MCARDDAMLEPETGRRLLDAWDAQQSALVAWREERFRTMLWVLEQMLEVQDRPRNGADLVVLDVASGPGAISDRVLAHFPGATVIAIDFDPSLLSIARAAVGSVHGERFRAIEADLAGAWHDALPPEVLGRVDAALSATALHWLTPADLVGFYTALADVLQPDGAFLNADHLRYDTASRPGLSDLARRHDDQTQRAGHGNGAQTWDAWWATARQIDALAPLVAERDRRFARSGRLLRSSTEFHLSALTTSGFSESGVLSQYLDNLLIYARR